MTDAYPIGIEEEYFLADSETRNAVPRMPQALIRRCRSALGDQVQTELLQSQIEIATPVCTSLDEARGALRHCRSALVAATAEFGLSLFAAGPHPLAEWTAQLPTQEGRRGGEG